MTITITCSTPQYQVEKGIPVPATRHPCLPKYPFRVMKVGDSFLIPGIRPAARISHSLYNCALKAGVKISARTVAEGTRVWRIK